MGGKYPNTFYRVAVKALIRNDKGEVLLVKENSDKWDLPGGGVDHGEEPEAGLRRELLEEVGVSEVAIGRPVVMKPFWIEDKQAWLMWAVYEVHVADVEFYQGNGVTDITYLNVAIFAESEDERERFICQIAQL